MISEADLDAGMKVSERIDVINRIAKELQERFRFAEIDVYLHEFAIPRPEGSYTSKWTYSRDALSSVDLVTLGRIADDLGMGSIAKVGDLAIPPANWDGETDFRLFISHLAKHKDKATRLKSCLAVHAISGFVAHEDIHPTLEWQAEIERGLFSMDAMVAVHTPGFSQSMWCQQEVGFALGRGVKVISLRMGEDPTGFISKRQALPRLDRKAEDVAAEIATLLAKDPITAGRLQEAVAVRQAAFATDDIPF